MHESRSVIDKRTMGGNVPGLENTVAPPNAPSNIRIGVSTNRGPISTSVVCGGPFGCSGSFSIIWTNNGHILINRYVDTNLEITEPYLRIQDRKSKNVVDEGLRLPRRRWNTKYLRTMEISPFFLLVQCEDILHV